MTMLEKVARAICKQDYDDDKGWERYTLHAKAAVLALRELDYELLAKVFYGNPSIEVRAYNAIIDAILKND